jgi:hypothetical protein
MNIKENCPMYSSWQDSHSHLLLDFLKMFSMSSNLAKVGTWTTIKTSAKASANSFPEIDLVDYF